MFEGNLTTLSTRDLLKSCADTHAAEHDAAARQLEHAVEYADRFHPDAVADRADCAARADRRRAGGGRERAVVLGGDGCPPVLEFCVSEFGAVLGLSPGVARDRIATALALRSRFPFIWARVLDREATAWKARNLARDCEKLSLEAALYVDREVAPILDTISPTRLAKIIKAAKMHAAPDLAKAEAAEKTAERGVWVGQSNEHGTKTCVIKAASAAVLRHKAKIDEIAAALLAQGDKRSIHARRAEAVGIMPDTAFTNELLAQAQEHQRTNPAPTPDPTSMAAAGPSNPPAPTSAPATSSTPAPAPTTASTAAPAPTPTTASAPAPTPARATASPAPAPTPASGPGPAPAPTATTAPAPAPDTDTAAALSNVATSNNLRGDRARSASIGPRLHDTPDLADEFDVHDEPGLDEPGVDDEADREAPHPGESELPDPLDQSAGWTVEPFQLASDSASDTGESMSPDEMRALAARLAQIKRDAHTRPPSERPTPARPGKTEIYLHLTDHTLATGTGVLRMEELGPLLATQFTEAVGYGPYVVKPVIDLNKAISSDAYETTNQIREHIKLTHPTEQFPYGTRETTNNIDLDHIDPYDSLGPPGQTNTQNLMPLSRFGHRVKTHARGWKVRRIDAKTIEWTTPHGFVLHVKPTGTHRVDGWTDAPERG